MKNGERYPKSYKYDRFTGNLSDHAIKHSIPIDEKSKSV